MTMCAREPVLDLLCFGIYLDRIQVIILNYMNKNVRGTTSVQRVDANL
jgi:hypothetical protein